MANTVRGFCRNLVNNRYFTLFVFFFTIMSVFFEEVHKKKLEDLQKVEDKIDELLDEQKRRAKVEKLQEKVLRMREDLEVFESLYAFTKSAKEKIENIG